MRSLPSIFLLPLSLISDKVHTYMLAKFCNHLLQGQTLERHLHEIEGKSICILISDANCRFNFRFLSGRLHAIDEGRADVIISGNANEFWLLATRQEDADTLFFRRSLSIEGETETGVYIKNILDSLDFDWDAHFDTFLFPSLALVAKDLKKKAMKIKSGCGS